MVQLHPKGGTAITSMMGAMAEALRVRAAFHENGRLQKLSSSKDVGVPVPWLLCSLAMGKSSVLLES